MDQRFFFDTVPFFTHFSVADRAAFLAASRERRFSAGDVIELRSSDSLHVVVSGLFRPEGALQRDESVLFGPGSLFGALPFAGITSRGTVKAVVESSVRVITLEDVSRILIGSYRTARGFIRVLSRSGLEMNAAAGEVAERRPRIIAVTGGRGAGKTISAICLARALSKEGKTILLDMTITGRSSFDYLQMKLLPPLSQKKAGSMSDSFLLDRITHAPAGFDLLNISAGSRVAVDEGIHSPVMFYLSRFYSYIVVDCGSVDDVMSRQCVSLADFVCAAAKRKRDVAAIRAFCDRSLHDGQELFFCDNRCFAKRPFEDSLMTLEKIPVDSEEGIVFELDEVLAGAERAVRKIAGARELYVLRDAGFSSALYAGLLPALPGTALVAAESLPLICALLYLSAGGGRRGERDVAAFFREEHIRVLTAPVFPDKWLLSSSPVRRAFDSVRHSLRLEHLGTPVIAGVGRPDAPDILAASGSVRELASASFCEQPLFQPVRAGRSFLCAPSSGGIGRALSLSVDSINVCSITPAEDGEYRSVIPIVRGVFDERRRRNPLLSEKWISERNIVIDADSGRQSIKKTIASSCDKWMRAFEGNIKD